MVSLSLAMMKIEMKTYAFVLWLGMILSGCSYLDMRVGDNYAQPMGNNSYWVLKDLPPLNLNYLNINYGVEEGDYRKALEYKYLQRSVDLARESYQTGYIKTKLKNVKFAMFVAIEFNTDPDSDKELLRAAVILPIEVISSSDPIIVDWSKQEIERDKALIYNKSGKSEFIRRHAESLRDKGIYFEKKEVTDP